MATRLSPSLSVTVGFVYRSGVVSHPALSAKSRLNRKSNTDIRCMGFLMGDIIGESIAEDGERGKSRTRTKEPSSEQRILAAADSSVDTVDVIAVDVLVPVVADSIGTCCLIPFVHTGSTTIQSPTASEVIAIHVGVVVVIDAV